MSQRRRFLAALRATAHAHSAVGLAEFQRDLINDRTKALGVKMGRPPKLTAHQKKEAIKRRDHSEETLAKIGRSYNVSD